MLRLLVPGTILVALATLASYAQGDADLSPYLLRLEHGNAYSSTCVLLQNTGAYHLELEDTNNTKVFKGSLQPDDLQQLVTNLKVFLDAVPRQGIEEPLIVHRDLVKLDIERQGRWVEVKLLSVESQEPYRESLQPIVRWLNDLHKLPHKELSEDAGKNNCLPPGKIALKKRPDQPPPTASDANNTPARLPSEQDNPTPPSKPRQALLRMDSFGVKSGTYHQDCVLVIDDGSYRAESRSQKTGSKTVEAKLNGGRLTETELSQLQEILSDSNLSEIHHRKTSHLELPVSGEMVELKIFRRSGLQEIVLSSTFNHRDVPFFYSGDGDIAHARPLLNFLSEHVNNRGLGSLNPQMRNACTEAP